MCYICLCVFNFVSYYAFILLGSNLSDKESNHQLFILQTACRWL